MLASVLKAVFGLGQGIENANDGSGDNVSEEKVDTTSKGVQVEKSGVEAEVIVERVGTITSFDMQFGSYIIDRKYKGDLNAMEIGSMPKKEMKVVFSAKFCPLELNWIVTSVKPLKDEKQQLIEDRRRFRSANFMVKALHKDTAVLNMGYSNDEGITVPLSMLPKDYPILTGDWMHVELELGNEAEVYEATILSVEWSDRAVICDRLVRKDGNWSVKGVYVSTELKEQYPVRENDNVKVISVESDQNKPGSRRNLIFYRKRALDLIVTTPLASKSQEPEKELEDWVEEDRKVEEVLQDRVEDLLRDKFSVRIRPAVLTVQLTKVGCTADKLMEIENRSASEIVLKNVRVEGIQDVCKVSVVNLDDTEVRRNSCIASNTVLTVKISCTPTDAGRTKELVVFEFEYFSIGRIVKIATAQDETDKILNQWTPDANGRALSFSEASHSVNAFQDHAEWISVTPVRPSFFIPNKVPRFEIPHAIKDAYETESDEALRKIYPDVDFTALDSSNYVARFSAALYFEELEQKKIRNQATIYDVPLVKLNEQDVYSMEIPGNHELGFQIQRADQILIEDVNNRRFNYKGYVERVKNTTAEYEIHIKLSDRFDYSGGGVNVKFILARTPFRRQHFALRQAMEFLGPEWLFPIDVEAKPPRIVVVEDRLERCHPTYSAPPFAKAGKKDASKETTERPLGFRAPMFRAVESRVYLPNSDLMKKLKFRWFNSSLNKEQKDAVRRILRGQGRPLPYVIFGPPGTGKTVTVVEAILQIYSTEKISRILVTAPSNAAADIITELLISTNRFKPGDLIRLNGFVRSEAGTSDTIADFCMDGEYMESVAKHRLIISTITTAGRFFELNLYTGHFSHVFIDEAGYCTEPEAMIACVLAAIDRQGQVILAGDPKQLGPVLKCNIEVNSILPKSFLERLMETPVYCRDEERFSLTKYNPVVLTKLVKNYRSHPSLLKIPSSLFYHDELQPKASRKESYELCESLDFLPKPGIPLIFHGVQGRCTQDPNSPSCYNAAEVSKVAQYVQLLKNQGIEDEDIGIITPYRKQVEKIRTALSFYLMQINTIKVASVQEFQGGEKKVIIISTVRSDNTDAPNVHAQNLEFLYSEKLFNVAVTRAKALMIIVGNPYVLYPSECWGKMLRYCVELGVYKGCDLPVPVNTRLLNMVETVEEPKSGEASFLCPSSEAATEKLEFS